MFLSGRPFCTVSFLEPSSPSVTQGFSSCRNRMLFRTRRDSPPAGGPARVATCPRHVAKSPRLESPTSMPKGWDSTSAAGGTGDAALPSTLPQMPFPSLAVKARPEKRRGCGNCGLASSAPGGAKPQFPRHVFLHRSRSNPPLDMQKRTRKRTPRHRKSA